MIAAVDIVVAAVVALGRGLAEIPAHYRRKRKEQAEAVRPQVDADVRHIDGVVAEARERDAAWNSARESAPTNPRGVPVAGTPPTPTTINPPDRGESGG